MAEALTSTTTPYQLGYRMPAEWEPHAGTWLSWPRPEGISFPDRYETIPPVYAELIRRLTEVEEVNVTVWDEGMEATAREFLIQAGTSLERVRFHRFPSYEPWSRDHGPIFLVRDLGEGRDRAVVDWGFNAWGGKYPPYDLDDEVPRRVAEARGLPLFSPDMVLEGGAIDVNGEGTLLTTEACLLNPNRNPNLSQKEIAQLLREFLGVSKVLWLGRGLAGDDTDGHIDTLARFINSTTVAAAVEEDPSDVNYEVLQENLRRLSSFRDQDEKPLRLVKLPMPGATECQGQRLPATYLNFYIANGLVVVPTFRHANDARALEILQREFPDRKVIGLDSVDLIWGLGSFHCITQQEPL